MLPTDVLAVSKVSVAFGGLTAVNEVTFSVTPGQVCGLIGPNGAGKTTLFNSISGHQAITGGSVFFRNQDITRDKASQRARLGMARTFQHGGCIDELTVLENVVIGADHRGRTGERLRRRDRLTLARDQLERFGLTRLETRLAGTLPAGLRREVEIARAMACGGKLLLLDEPAVGLTEDERRRLLHIVRELAESHGMSVVLCDHNTDLVFAASDHVVALDFGSVIAQGSPSEIRSDNSVLEAYLGLGETTR